jgi:hypothetical protein
MSLNTIPLLNSRETRKPNKNSMSRMCRNGAKREKPDGIYVFAISELCGRL